MKSRIVLGICVTLLLTGSLSANTKFTEAVDNLWSNPDVSLFCVKDLAIEKQSKIEYHWA